MSLSNLIKNFLNIQDDNITFPEEEYCQVTQKGDYRIKIFKGFLKSNYCACPHCNSKNIVKNGSRHRKIKYIPIQNYNIELELSVQRYEEMIKQGKTPRMTPKEHHDLVVSSIGDNLETIYNSKLFDEIRLFDRENNLLYSYKKTPDVSPKDILVQEFCRKWEKEEIEEYNQRWNNLIKTMKNRKASTEEISKVIIEKEEKV